MPSNKRKRGKQRTSSKFLDLPLEIRTKIYEYCYAQVCAGKYVELRAKSYRSIQTRGSAGRTDRNHIFFENSRCEAPLTHLSLLLTCRQTYADVWPHYTACHSLNFENPVNFANEYLYIQAPHRLAMIKHLSLHVKGKPGLVRIMSVTEKPELPQVKDTRLMFDHFPDVFRDLLSFTWQWDHPKDDTWDAQDTAEAQMWTLILRKLIEYNRQQRYQSTNGNKRKNVLVDKGKQNKWRVGIVRRMRSATHSGGKPVAKDESSLLFFERTPQNEEQKTMRGMRYINVDKWVMESPPRPTWVRGAYRCTTSTPACLHLPRDFDASTESVDWSSGGIESSPEPEYVDLRSAVVRDVGSSAY